MMPNTSGTGFYGSNDPTNSVKALKEGPDRIRLQSRQVHPHRVTIIQHIMQYDVINTKTQTSVTLLSQYDDTTIKRAENRQIITALSVVVAVTRRQLIRFTVSHP